MRQGSIEPGYNLFAEASAIKTLSENRFQLLEGKSASRFISSEFVPAAKNRYSESAIPGIALVTGLVILAASNKVMP